MATMNISLPESMRDWVENRLQSGLYASNSDYIRDLIRKDQQQTQKLATMQAAIAAGLESGDAGELDIQAIKRKARQQASLAD